MLRPAWKWNTLVNKFLWRNIQVAINFAGMLLEAYWQHMLLLETAKSLRLSSGDIEMETHKITHSAAAWAYVDYMLKLDEYYV